MINTNNSKRNLDEAKTIWKNFQIFKKIYIENNTESNMLTSVIILNRLASIIQQSSLNNSNILPFIYKIIKILQNENFLSW